MASVTGTNSYSKDEAVEVQQRLTTHSVGTVTTPTTTLVEEHGDELSHVTKLTMTKFVVGQGADNASLGIGTKFYTFPAGTIKVKDVTMVGSLSTDLSVTAQTPEIGIGSVVASGAVAVLSGTATFEEYVNGNLSSTGGDTTAADLAGTVFYKDMSDTSGGILVKLTGGKSHDLFLNAAVAWADVTAAANVYFTGVITLSWGLVYTS